MKVASFASDLELNNFMEYHAPKVLSLTPVSLNGSVVWCMSYEDTDVPDIGRKFERLQTKCHSKAMANKRLEAENNRLARKIRFLCDRLARKIRFLCDRLDLDFTEFIHNDEGL